MSSFTPGPWHRDGHNLAAVIHCTTPKGSPEAKHLCGDYETIARCEGSNWEANGRLIASAPELLEALKYALRFMKHEDHDTVWIDGIISKAEALNARERT